ncbi:MAG TPA: hypothetical protein DCK98_01220 [Chloroflexi bacterium]|jgi:transcriptional regulator with XRE-family HTH domain/Zn-dependent peptidase ImmA (M78 family)|nr:hypothetical protein [Chloroflexota bacterium]HAL27673.1 hypothetical protein [Chloroflexota bacterium]
MIKNDRQYRITKAQVDRFNEALHAAQTRPSTQHPLLVRAEQDALRSQADDLRRQLAEYDRLRSGREVVLTGSSIEDLPRLLVSARIARGLTQRELAERLGLQEQQIQKYEATDYAGASLARIQEVIEALGIAMREDVFLPVQEFDAGTLFRRLEQAGLHRDFVLARLLPRRIAAHLEQSRRGAEAWALQAAYVVARIFDWKPSDLITGASLQLGGPVVAAARFKVAKHANPDQVTAYAVYAHYLALLLLEVTKPSRVTAPVRDPLALRQAIVDRYGSLTFASALRYTWDQGIPVLPLRDAAAFHGAYWRTEGRGVIVLKQRTTSSSRWLFDLGHELWHTGEAPTQPELQHIEPDDQRSAEVREDEQHAMEFAGAILLAGRGEELANTVVRKAQGKLERFKRVVPEVARDADVSVSSLANYIAYRVDFSGDFNWWPVAQNLQEPGPEPWSVARDILLEQADLAGLNPRDRDILDRALQ